MKVFKIWDLVVALFSYLLGFSMAKFMQSMISWLEFSMGLLSTLLLIAAGFFLEERFAYSLDRIAVEEKFRRSKKPGLTHRSHLLTGLVFLAASAIPILFLTAVRHLSLPAGLVYFFYLAGLVIHCVPPFRLNQRGMGEITKAILIGCLVPGFAFFLQTSSPPRFLLFAIFPLTLLIFCRELALSLESFEKTTSGERVSFMERIGWRSGTVIHNIGILTAIILMCVLALAGQPWKLTWPGLLVAPIGFFQIWLVIRITQGATPRWRLLAMLANALALLPAYFISLAIWIR